MASFPSPFWTCRSIASDSDCRGKTSSSSLPKVAEACPCNRDSPATSRRLEIFNVALLSSTGFRSPRRSYRSATCLCAVKGKTRKISPFSRWLRCRSAKYRPCTMVQLLCRTVIRISNSQVAQLQCQGELQHTAPTCLLTNKSA